MAQLALLGLLIALAGRATGWPCSPSSANDCPKPPGGLQPSQVPQFITITWDDAVDPQSYGIIQKILGGLRQRNGCRIPSTFFVLAKDTVPAAVQALYLQGNEIATHTMTHVGYPSAAEIIGCREWLVKETGIPRSKINGFRAPFLLSDADTRRTLVKAGFLYDSSIPDTTPSRISRSVTQRGWPYSMAQGIPQKCDTGKCSSSEKYPVFEIPLWAAADAHGRPIASMDPPGDAFEIYKREAREPGELGLCGMNSPLCIWLQLGWRLSGNHAPLGLFFHAGMESDRVDQLRQFIKYAAAIPNVWFLLAWIQHPVPASKVATSLKCTKPNDISGHACSTYVADCVFGSWSSRLCRCVCLDEGRRGGYCRDHSTGECSRLC
ncbi:hypothetical protein ABPG77_007011 [Micractinium sp. CCAP 211/92]